MPEASKKKIAIITSSPTTIKSFLSYQIKILSNKYIVYLILNLTGESKKLLSDLPKDIIIYNVPIHRKINLFLDLKSLLILYKIFIKEKFHLIHSFTPKAGLISSISGFFAKVPNRLHTFTGQIWANFKGLNKFFFQFADKIIFKLNTFVLIDSHAQKSFLLSNNIINDSKSKVLGSGSLSGVDFHRFKPNSNQKEEIRKIFNIPKDTFLLIFVGRLKKDKGILDLTHSLRILIKKNLKISLLIIGPDEENLLKYIKKEYLDIINEMLIIPYFKNPEKYICAADLFIMPSYREGFGTSIIEAAACGVPTVASRIYGLADTVIEEETGLFFEPGDVNDLAKKIQYLYNNRKICNSFGENAMKRVHKYFGQDLILKELLSFYNDKLNS